MAVESQGEMPNAPLKAYSRKHSQNKHAHSVAASKKTKCGSAVVPPTFVVSWRPSFILSREKHQPRPRLPKIPWRQLNEKKPIHSRVPIQQKFLTRDLVLASKPGSSTRACSVSYNYAWEYFRREKAWYIYHVMRAATVIKRHRVVLWRKVYDRDCSHTY